jgi:hypothetical protein
MWVFMTDGFVSITNKPGDLETGMLTVRGRDELSVTLLWRHCPGASPIRAYEGTDYEYRFTAPKEEVVLAVADEVRAIDYSGFKRTSERRRGHWYGDALMEVWVTMMRAYWARRNGR